MMNNGVERKTPWPLMMEEDEGLKEGEENEHLPCFVTLLLKSGSRLGNTEGGGRRKDGGREAAGMCLAHGQIK